MTNADLDHALGLLLLRQQDRPLTVYANNEVRTTLQWLEAVAGRFCGIRWEPIGNEFISLGTGISFRTISLSRSSVFQMRDDASGATALVAPAVGEITDDLHRAIATSDAVFFDGTFWSNDELAEIRPGARNARAMDHLPINDGTLDLLRQSSARRKVYTHINNTNPILMPGSKERRQVEQAGIEIGNDGLEISL